MKKSISMVMPVRINKNIIDQIVENLFIYSSKNVCEFIFVVDGCTDRTEEIIQEQMCRKLTDKPIRLLYANDVYETKACNLGFHAAKGDYICNFQDDMLINEKDYDQRMMKPFSVIPELIGVTARDAVNVRIKGDELDFYDVFGKDVNSPRNIFGIRDIINRGPILFNHEKLEEMNYLDESFIMFQDDTDLFLRAYQEKGYMSGAYVVNYESPLQWGSTRKNPHKVYFFGQLEKRNMKYVAEKYRDLILADKHNLDIILE